MMRDPLERITVAAAGTAFDGWSEISVSVSAEEAVRTATMKISDFAGRFPLMPGTPVTLAASGDLLLTGYVRDCNPAHSPAEHSVTVNLVSRSVDATEASIDHATGYTKDKSLDDIAREFDTCGVGIVCDESFPVERPQMVNTGSTLFEHLRPLARSHGALIYDTPEGRLRIAKRPRGRHAGALMIGTGGNIIEASAALTEFGRHDEVIVRGQQSLGKGAAALRMQARFRDGGVSRRRPLVIVHESEASSQKLKERAERRGKRAAGFARTANITVAGWRDGAGRLFEPHFIVAVRDPRIYIDGDMVIKSVTLTQLIEGGGPGTRAALSLADPRALNGESPMGDSDGVWSAPGGEASVEAA